MTLSLKHSVAVVEKDVLELINLTFGPSLDYSLIGRNGCSVEAPNSSALVPCPSGLVCCF